MIQMVKEAKTELAKFFQLIKENVPNLNMPSSAIDATWHSLLKSQEYRSFCHQHAGQVVGHEPASGHGLIEWTEEYEKRFGTLPMIWFIDEYGKLNHQEYNQYKKTGKWISSWDCKPKK